MLDGALSSHDPPPEGHLVRRLLWFFALVYAAEGLSQTGGLISQPLVYYLKQVHGWTPSRVTAFGTIFALPWMIKPIYGLISDFLPLLGYRRKSYLLIASVAAIAGYFWVTQINAPDALAFALLIPAYAMAISSTLSGAVLVENGQRLNESGRFVNQQWLWYNIAFMAATIIGGQLVQHLAPTTALHAAAGIGAIAPFAVIIGTLFLIPEQKVAADLAGMRRTLDGLISAFKARTVDRRLLHFSLSIQSGFYHASVLSYDGRSEILAGLYRRTWIDLRRRRDCGRSALSALTRPLDAQGPAQR